MDFLKQKFIFFSTKIKCKRRLFCDFQTLWTLNCTLFEMWVTSAIRNPIMTFHMRTTIALKSSLRIFNHQLSIRTRSSSKLFKTSTLARIKNVVFEAITFRSTRSRIVGKILSGRTRSRRLLLETFLTLWPIINIPFWFAMTSGTSTIRVQVEQFASFAWSLRKLSVTSLMGGPPVPIIEAFAILFIFASGTTIRFEDQPFAKFAGTSGIWLVTPAIFSSSNLGQTSALNIESFEGFHKTRSSRTIS